MSESRASVPPIHGPNDSPARSTRRVAHRWTTAMALVLLALGELWSGITGANDEKAQVLDGYERFVSDDGRFRFSRGATRGLAHLGSWFVPAGEAAGFHHVYTQPAAIEAYRRTGVFPDGTALVKEITSHRRANYTTGADVASATATRQWFLMVKDMRQRFPGSATWGNGWGWALFESGEPSKNVATDYGADCLGCHLPARSTDWVYTAGYPLLEPEAGRPRADGRNR